ncbi:MAG: hypothetical protein AAF333_19330 [Planctomycetota bacterium]
MRAPPPRPAPITLATKNHLHKLFEERDYGEVEKLLVEDCGQNLPFCEDYYSQDLDRLRFAVLKLSGGDIDQLKQAIDLAKTDWRDLLMAAGFGYDTSAHLSWHPTPKE